jgi:hypothetical protein
MMYGSLLYLIFMKKSLPLAIIFCAVCLCSFGQEFAKPVFSLYLIGDAGKASVSSVLYKDTLQYQLAHITGPSAVVFLGDNIYPNGMPSLAHKERAETEAILKAQINLISNANANSQVYFVPGNHDWKRGKKVGLERLLNQQQWFDSLQNPFIKMLPRDGCPGPVEVSLSDELTLVIFDTQWFLHPWDKPEGDNSPCDVKNFADAFTQLEDILKRNLGKRVVVTGHHPVFTYGEHGGSFNLKQHIFPLTEKHENLYIPFPVIGSIYPLYRKIFGDIQDVSHPQYKLYRESLRKVLEQFPGTVFASGHDHSLQLSIKDSIYYVVSGAGVKNSYVKKRGHSKFASSDNGFVKLTVLNNGETVIEYFSAKRMKNAELVYQQRLKAISSPRIDVNKSTIENKMTSAFASGRYSKGKSHSKWFGENYRKAWAQPVEVPVVDLKQEKGGLKILQRGGGMQTLSLRLSDSTGHEYTLRSIEKFPEKAVPEALRKTFIQDIVQDQISASHPYAALVVPDLAKAAGIYHTNPKLVYLPDDARLGIYRKDFANQLMLFEERPEGSATDMDFFGNADKIISTAKVLEKLEQDNDNHVDQPFVLKSRIFDLFIGDWDRHDDQWRWAVFKEKKGEKYQPIPRDRDQAFFVNEGIVPKLWSRKWAFPKFQGFDEQMSWPPGFMFNARYFDRSFLNELTREDWILAAEKMTVQMSDQVIESSLKQWPDEIYKLDGETIIRKLKARKLRLADYALEHYLFLAREVDIVGTSKKELFDIERLENGNVSIKMFKISKGEERGSKLYEREFFPAETREIRLYGLAGDDEFVVRDTTSTIQQIKIRIIGGEGIDKVSNEISDKWSRIFVYDLKNDVSVVNQKSIRDRTSTNPSVNEYNRKAFQYDRLAPLLYGNINVDDGIFLGGGFFYTTHGFRKSPYKSQHIFLGSYAFNTSSFNFKYDGRFTSVIGKWNLEIDADVKSPNFVNNFFGMGNESVFDKNIDDLPGVEVEHAIQYYRLRFKEYTVKARLSRQLHQYGFFKIGPAYQQIEIEDPESKDRFISTYAASLSKPLIEASKSFAGLNYSWGIDKRNDKILTTRGLYMEQSTTAMLGVNSGAKNFLQHQASISFYQSFKFPARVTFAVRAGGGITQGDYEIYQAQVLDGKTELRGFRKTRFYGDSKFFTNAETRIKLANIRSYLFPASFGALGFYDVGRVWYKDASGKDPSASNGKSETWHNGFGGGLWITPFNLTVLSAEVGHSVEGTLFYARLGFLF